MPEFIGDRNKFMNDILGYNDNGYGTFPYVDNIDDAIKSMENVRKINEELRSALEEALEIIRYLDEHIINLEKEINKYEDMVTRSKERWG